MVECSLEINGGVGLGDKWLSVARLVMQLE